MKWRSAGMTLIFGLMACPGVRGQQIDFHRFVNDEDAVGLKAVKPDGDGFIRTYELMPVQVYDLDADSTTYVMNRQMALLCVEGQLTNNKREGVFSFYLTDKEDQKKRYKVWEQTFSNNKLNGQWRTYTLRGGLVRIQTYKNDSLNGVSRTYWIDGKGIMDEREYFNGQNKFTERTFFRNGKTELEMPYESGKPNGTIRRYYETGVLQETQQVKNGVADGVRRLYYPNGQLSVDQVFRAGRNWEIRGNYTQKGLHRKAGTLHNGTGTIIYYNEDGTVREVKTFVNGVAK
jgi:antitoxin component YwqK of YwqJK toxin-antitoxin module